MSGGFIAAYDYALNETFPQLHTEYLKCSDV